MKLTSYSLLAAAVLMTLTGNTQAATITATDLGQLGTMPGSTTDYDFLPPGSPSHLADFSAPAVTPGMNTWGPGGGPDYATILSPTGASVNTGIIFTGAGDQPDMVQYTLGASSTFNFNNFNVYFMYGNTFDPGPRDGTVTLTLLASNDITVLKSLTVNLSDLGGADITKAQFEEFTVKGAAAGDILQFGATTAPNPEGGYQAYVAGVSFSANPVPEPSTWAMMIAGLAVLGFCVRRKGAAVK